MLQMEIDTKNGDEPPQHMEGNFLENEDMEGKWEAWAEPVESP